ncbi:linear amide C-N hydrolase [Salmonella enterica subsp. enterica serovar Montevideo]|nr:choloylglycine hydrolase family protein [Salmonella enterica subsp. enterica serovar Montevideo]
MMKRRNGLRMKTTKPLLSLAAGLVLGAGMMAGSLPAEACTSFVLPTTDGKRIYARTMEFEFDMKSSLVGMPRHLALSGTGPEGKTGMQWQAKYAAVGMNAFGLPSLLDGMNEKGLAGGILYFPGYAHYAPWKDEDQGNTLAPWDVLTWALTNFATVAEVKAALKDVRIADVKQANMGISPPVHYTLHDATGASLVIEPVNGELKVYDNPLGVMTNSPSLDWHLTNLRNYVNLRPENVDSLKINNYTVHAFGTGSGMHGIPGDSSPPSRFVRAAAYVLSAQKVPDGVEGVRLAEHIANNFDMPKGLVQDAHMPPEYTQWTAIADTGTDRYYIKTWASPVLHGVGFDSFDVNGTKMMTFSFPDSAEPGMLKAASAPSDVK